MTQRSLVLLLLFLNIPFHLYSQKEVLIADFKLFGNDTIFFSDLPEVEVLDFKSKKERNAYFYLKRRVLKVYPYALVAKKKLDEIELVLDTLDRKRYKRNYTKEVAKWVKEEYTDRLKDLTMSEGRILVKLIYRETNITSYDILREYRGVFNAFIWQTMAKFWDNDLKSEYDPVNNREDKLIEYIITHKDT